MLIYLVCIARRGGGLSLMTDGSCSRSAFLYLYSPNLRVFFYPSDWCLSIVNQSLCQRFNPIWKFLLRVHSMPLVNQSCCNQKWTKWTDRHLAIRRSLGIGTCMSMSLGKFLLGWQEFHLSMCKMHACLPVNGVNPSVMPSTFRKYMIVHIL